MRSLVEVLDSAQLPTGIKTVYEVLMAGCLSTLRVVWRAIAVIDSDLTGTVPDDVTVHDSLHEKKPNRHRLHCIRMYSA